jgi:hypothetical protein
LFDGATVIDTIRAVLTREPDYSKAPEKVRRLLRPCLEKGEIFNVAGDERLMAAEVPTKAGEAHALFGPLSTARGHQYDVSADGQHILAITSRQNASEAVTIVQNWPAGLKK